MAHGKGSTGNPSDVPDMEEMAASPEKLLAKPSTTTTTSRGTRGYNGKMGHRDCNSSKEGAAESVALGKWPRSTTPPRRGWQSVHLSGVIKNHVRAVEAATSSFVNVGVLV